MNRLRIPLNFNTVHEMLAYSIVALGFIYVLLFSHTTLVQQIECNISELNPGELQRLTNGVFYLDSSIPFYGISVYIHNGVTQITRITELAQFSNFHELNNIAANDIYFMLGYFQNQWSLFIMNQDPNDMAYVYSNLYRLFVYDNYIAELLLGTTVEQGPNYSEYLEMIHNLRNQLLGNYLRVTRQSTLESQEVINALINAENLSCSLRRSLY